VTVERGTSPNDPNPLTPSVFSDYPKLDCR
jgi:hypothetical protein